MSELASTGQLRMSFLRVALVTVPLILFLGILSGALAGSGTGNPWFAALAKPAEMPPAWAFPAAWTLLYILIGFALAMIIWARGASGRGMSVDIAWRLETGRPDVVIAVHDSGIMWNNVGDMSQLRAKFHLNRGELPARRFRHIAGTALMVLRNPEGGRRREKNAALHAG